MGMATLRTVTEGHTARGESGVGKCADQESNLEPTD